MFSATRTFFSSSTRWTWVCILSCGTTAQNTTTRRNRCHKANVPNVWIFYFLLSWRQSTWRFNDYWFFRFGFGDIYLEFSVWLLFTHKISKYWLNQFSERGRSCKQIYYSWKGHFKINNDNNNNRKTRKEKYSNVF